LNGLAGCCSLAGGWQIVDIDLHEVGRYGGTAYWSCLAQRETHLHVGAGWVLWMNGRWLDIPQSIGW